MNRQRKVSALVVSAVMIAAPMFAQGPASCGYHLDIRSNLTGTHAAVADMPASPGSGGFPMPPGAPGNPYTAYATPGSPMSIIISGNPLTYGPAPIGAGSCLSLLYSIGAAMIPIVTGPPFIPPCPGVGPTVVGILPIAGSVFDSCGFLAPPPPVGFYDLGSGRFIFTGLYPAFAPPGVTFQAAGITPAGLIWITNAVAIFPAPNPSEAPVAPLIPCGVPLPTADGQSVGNPTPPGFLFYGVPSPFVDIDVDGYADFVPGNGPAIAGGCDTTGASGDFGCAVATATARPRIDVNHISYDMGVVPAAPFVPAMTMEFRPPGPAWPPAFIYRWKNMPAAGAAAGIAGLSTAALAMELHGDCSFCIPPLFPPGRIAVVRSWLIGIDQCGIGPGIAGQGYFGPPPAAPTCALGAGGLPFMGTFGGFPPFLGVPGGAIHMDLAASSTAVFNSAIVFTPMGLPAPDAYMLVVY